MLTREQFLRSLAGAGLLSFNIGCTDRPAKTSVLPASTPEGLKLPSGESTITLHRRDGSEINIPVIQAYPRTVAINTATFEEIIRLSEEDQNHGFPNFSLSLENKATGLDGYNARTWKVVNGRFTEVKTEVGIDLRMLSGIIATGLLTRKYDGKTALQGTNPGKMIDYIPDNAIQTHTVQDLAVANLTAVLAEELFEANWSAKYQESHTEAEYKEDFPAPETKEQITDQYSLPYKVRIFNRVLEGSMDPAFIFPQSALVTRETLADFFRLAKATETQVKQIMQQQSARLQRENIR